MAMNILLVYPKYPDTFWSFKHALKFVFKKAALPPLGLLTIAPMLPNTWKKKLIDLNVEPLKEKHILWADYIFLDTEERKEFAQKPHEYLIEVTQQQQASVSAATNNSVRSFHFSNHIYFPNCTWCVCAAMLLGDIS